MGAARRAWHKVVEDSCPGPSILPAPYEKESSGRVRGQAQRTHPPECVSLPGSYVRDCCFKETVSCLKSEIFLVQPIGKQSGGSSKKIKHRIPMRSSIPTSGYIRKIIENRVLRDISIFIFTATLPTIVKR